MKKIIYACIVCLVCINSIAQTLNKSDLAPQKGDNYLKHKVDNPSALDPGSGGLSQIWDLSNASITLQNDFYYEIVNPASTPNTVPGATFAIMNYPVTGTHDSGYIYYRDSINGYQIMKEIDPNFTFNYFPSEFIYKFPLNYGDSVISDYNFSSTAFSTTYNYKVNAKLKFDGTGTLYGGSAPIANVYRLVYTNESIRQSPNDKSYTIKYIWYKAGTHHPLAEYIAYLDPNGTTYYAANLYSLTNGTGITEINGGNNIAVFPNPANTSATVTNSESFESITITDITGQMIYEKQNNKSKVFSFETNEFVNGIYFLHLWHNQTSVTQKFIVQH